MSAIMRLVSSAPLNELGRSLITLGRKGYACGWVNEYPTAVVDTGSSASRAIARHRYQRLPLGGSWTQTVHTLELPGKLDSDSTHLGITRH